MNKFLSGLAVVVGGATLAGPLSVDLVATLTKQIDFEHYSAYLYDSMANHFEAIMFKGFAHWMRHQAAEELKHAAKLEKFVTDRGGRVELGGVEKPPHSWDSLIAVFSAALDHERLITSKINAIDELATAAKDPATHELMLWYAHEQVDEENNADTNLQHMKLAGDNMAAIFALDAELGKRGVKA